jgi:hypothetical protein
VKKYNKQDQKLLAAWAAECAERVLPYFENANTKDDRPRQAIEICRIWIRTGEMKMAVIRGASLQAHAAAREVIENKAACFAARAAGQAVATAHVAQHAFGAPYYALKAIEAADPGNAEVNIAKEWNWQVKHLSAKLRDEVIQRVKIIKVRNGYSIKIHKDKND